MRKPLVVIYLILIVILGFGWRFLLINKNEGVIFDEGFDFIQAQNSVQTLITGRYSDFYNHPFLHYLFLHFWTKIDTSEFFIRLPFLIFGIIGILGMFFLGKEMFQSEKLGLLAAFFLASSAFSVVYSSHVRITQVFLTTEIFALIFYWKATQQNKWIFWINYSLFSIIALYLEYAAFWLIAILIIHFLILCLKDNFFKITRIKKWFWAHLIIILLYLPWLPIFLKGLSRALVTKEYLRSNTILKVLEKFLMGTDGFDSWVLPYRVEASQSTRENLTIGAISFFLFYFLIFFSLKLLKRDPRTEKGKVVLLSLFFLPLIVAQLMSFLGIFILHDRNQTIFIMGFILILVYLFRLSKTKIERLGFLLLLILFVFVNSLTIEYYLRNPLGLGETWRESAIFLKRSLQAGDLVVAKDGRDDWPMLYYLKYRYSYPFKQNNVVFLDFELGTRGMRKKIFRLLKKSPRKHLWLFGSAWEIKTFDNGDFWKRFVSACSNNGLEEEDFKLLKQENLSGIILYEGVYEH